MIQLKTVLFKAGMLRKRPAYGIPHETRPANLKNKQVYLRASMAFFIIRTACCLLVLLAGLVSPAVAEKLTFSVTDIVVTGNTLLAEKAIDMVVTPFTGEEKTIDDIENARQALEQFYRHKGYPTIVVNIPEQDVDTGVITLAVVEGKIRTARVTGNRYFTMEKIYNDLPAFMAGEILYLPKAQAQLNKINLNPDLKVTPVLSPGKLPGTVDVELKVKDQMPLHGSLELNNRASSNTSDLRLNGAVHYDNLWQKEHAISVQYQTSPEKTEEVQALSFSYMLHSPWNYSHLIAAYTVMSDSDLAFGDGFKVIGKGEMAGLRYVMPFEPRGRYTHNLTLGLDYKSFDDKLFHAVEQEGTTVEETPVSYTPISFNYQSAITGKQFQTQFNTSFNMVFRGVSMDVDEFENKRFKTRGNYMYLKTEATHDQFFSENWKLSLTIGGQLASQPLISNEQYAAGGMSSVRGYLESEISGDNAFYGSAEMTGPNLLAFTKKNQIFIRPYLFYEGAICTKKERLSGEENPDPIHGTGTGLKGRWGKWFMFQVDYGLALADAGKTESGKSKVHFQVKASF